MSSACSFIFMQIKVIFINMVSHLDSLWNRGTRELGNGLLSMAESMAESKAQSKASKRQRGWYCVAGASSQQSQRSQRSSPRILLWEANRFNSSTVHVALFSAHNFRRIVLWENLAVLSSMEAQGLKWISSLKRDAVPTKNTIVPPAPEELSDHRKRTKRQERFLRFCRSVQYNLCTIFVPSDQRQLA